MTVLGIDVDTRSLHLCLLNDDTNQGRYLHVPLVADKPPKEPFSFDDVRGLREVLNETIFEIAPYWGFEGWDSIRLVAVENPHLRQVANVHKYGLVIGALLAAVPSRVPVRLLAPAVWHQAFLGKGNARKGEQPVKTQAWVRAHELGFYSDDMNATDAYGIAWAARAMQEPP